MTNYVNCKNSEGSGNYRKLLKSEQKNILLIFMGFTENNKGTRKRLYVSDLSFKATADHHKEQLSMKKIASNVAETIPPITPIPTAFCAPLLKHRY